METKKTQAANDEQLWKIAKKRVGFRRHLLTYFACIAFFWAMWYFTAKHNGEEGIPWPVFPMLGWGFGLFFHFLSAYVFNSHRSIEREYEKLKKKQRE